MHLVRRTTFVNPPATLVQLASYYNEAGPSNIGGNGDI